MIGAGKVSHWAACGKLHGRQYGTVRPAGFPSLFDRTWLYCVVFVPDTDSPKGASSAEDADRWLTSERFDLLLLDIELPRMKGVEFLSWALSRDPEMAVIMLTGLDIPEVAIECMDQGARTYLVKPIEVDFLRLALRDALGLRRVLVERNDLASRA